MTRKYGYGVALSGGNVKGAYQAGALKFLLQEEDFKPEVVYGVSVGSLNGAILASCAGRAEFKTASGDIKWGDIADHLVDIWIDRVKKFGDLGKERGIGYMISTVLLQKISSSIRKYHGLVNMAKAEQLMRDTIDIDALSDPDNPVTYHCGVVDLLSGQYKRVSNRELQGEALMQYIIASTREPITMDVVEIDDRVYCDGGARNITPVDGPMVEVSNIAAIALDANHLAPLMRDKDLYSFVSILDRAKSTLINEVADEDVFKLKYVNPITGASPAVNYRLVQPEKPGEVAINRETFDTKDIRRLIEAGYARAQKSHWMQAP